MAKSSATASVVGGYDPEENRVTYRPLPLPPSITRKLTRCHVGIAGDKGDVAAHLAERDAMHPPVFERRKRLILNRSLSVLYPRRKRRVESCARHTKCHRRYETTSTVISYNVHQTHARARMTRRIGAQFLHDDAKASELGSWRRGGRTGPDGRQR